MPAMIVMCNVVSNFMQTADQLVSSKTTSFFDLSDEEISSSAKEATKAAVNDLHKNGISTYGERNGIMYETKLNGEKCQVAKVSSQI
jgi:hypothetical protein